MKLLKNIIILSLFVVTISSCKQLYEWNQPKDRDIEYSTTWPINGEWFITFKFDNGTGTIDDWYGLGYQKIMAYNTSGNSKDSIWIDDLKATWSFKGKVKCDPSNKIFGQNDSIKEIYNDIKFILKNGKIIEDGVTCTSGTKSDSIYFEIEFSDDPGTIYYVSGYRRTGYLEDEH